MDYVVFRSGGKQYRAKQGDTLIVDSLNASEDKSLVLEEVLLLVSDGKVSLGKPVIKGAKVKATVIGNFKGDKIRVSKFKAKVRYRRTIGFRPHLTRLKIESFGLESEAKTSKVPQLKTSEKVGKTVKK